MPDLTGWQTVVAGLIAVSVPAATALLGEWLGRRTAREALLQARADAKQSAHQARSDYLALQERWLQDRADVDRRRAEDERATGSRWSRDKAHELLEKGITLSLAENKRSQLVGVAQLSALHHSSLLQSEDADLVLAVLDAVVAGVGSRTDALAAAEDEDTEVIVAVDGQPSELGVPA